MDDVLFSVNEEPATPQPAPEAEAPAAPADALSTEQVRQQWHHDFQAAVHAATRLLGTAYTSLEINVGSRQARLLAPVLLESLVKGAMAEANELQALRLREAAALSRQRLEEELRQANPEVPPTPELQRPW